MIKQPFIKYIFLLKIWILQSPLLWCQTDQSLVKGITIVCPIDSLISNPFIELADLGANWTCIVPYRECSQSDFSIEKENTFGWYGLDITGVEQMIKFAHEAGLKVMLKPQLYLEDSWPGAIDFITDDQWELWENQYTAFIMEFLAIAKRYNVEMFCIGAELKNSVNKRPEYWYHLINEIRMIYDKEITYSSNWDMFENITFWEALDFIGISSYFPLTKKDNPSLPQLIKLWKPIVKDLKRYAYKKGKKILFTEYGYLSVDQTAYQHWVNEENLDYLNVNYDAQSKAIEALYLSWWNEKVWKGGYLWKWYPGKKGYSENWNKDYTPQGKAAEKIITKWFRK